MTEARKTVLSELYNELRAYRNKEFQTFLFGFPIIGAGLLPELASELKIQILLTVFGAFFIFYIWKNHFRMMLIKNEIKNFQELLGVLPDFKFLNPGEWTKKKPERHLGTVVYSFLLSGELVFLWFDLILKG